MADNTTLPGTGNVIATDDIGGVHYQLIKPAFGALDSATLVSPANPFPVVALTNSLVSTANSSTANLAGAAVFTGTAEDVSDYSHISVVLFSSHASATDGLQIQQSADGTNWDFGDTFTIPAATGKAFSAPVQAKFFRVVYTNGATLTTSFRLQVIFSKHVKKGSSIRAGDARSAENDFEEAIAYLAGFNGTSWDRLRSTIANGLAVDITRNSALVAGAAVIGKVGIDQTTPGTTNGVQITALSYPSSTGNNTAAQLAAGATFTGTVETILSLQAAQVEVVCDQPYTVTIFQYIDAAGLQLSSTDVFTRAANAPMNENITLPGNYFKLSIQNTGASATTTLKLDCTFGIMATSPRALTNLGNYKVAVLEALPAGTNTIGGVTIPDLTASGSLAALNATLALAMNQVGGASIEISGAWVGTISFEGTVSGSVWNPINGTASSTSTPGTTTTVNGLYRLTPAGLSQMRVNMSAFTSGSATVSMRSSNGSSGVFANQILPTKNTDGVSSQTIKAASTAAAFTDQAAVVDIRPGGVLAGMGASTTTGDTGAKTASGNGATQTNTGNKGIQVVIVLGAVSGTVPTCVFKMQVSVDAGTTWVDIPGAATASLAATGNFGISVYPGQAVTAGTTTTNTTATANGVMSRTWRVVWAIGGTVPSFTITSITYNYLPN